ncbi:MAG: SDR family NAD(P)-dependent oxidoreductase [Rhodothalassiaceae bacterium]
MSGKGFAGKVAIVTGGTSGIGAAVVEALCSAGAAVVFCGLRDGNGEDLESILRARHLEARFSHADVRADDEMAGLVAGCLRDYGRLDLAVNNAGISHPAAKLADIPPEIFRDVMRTNAEGVFLSMRHEIPAMLKGGGGAIVNVASILARRGAPWMAAYGASKHAVLGLTLSAARDYAAAGLRVNAVLPGPVATPMLERALFDIAGDETKYAGGFPPCGPGTPGDVAAAILFLLGTTASYINGAALVVDGATSAA